MIIVQVKFSEAPTSGEKNKSSCAAKGLEFHRIIIRDVLFEYHRAVVPFC